LRAEAQRTQQEVRVRDSDGTVLFPNLPADQLFARPAVDPPSKPW